MTYGIYTTYLGPSLPIHAVGHVARRPAGHLYDAEKTEIIKAKSSLVKFILAEIGGSSFFQVTLPKLLSLYSDTISGTLA